ncbi:hypothetical protein [Streptomyces sp. NPDC005438]|uniref:hypothetical protein n=1 Tax=Streptomyces sp. NPDC005438 TaxID=3156880 RepID=UPI0033A50325
MSAISLILLSAAAAATALGATALRTTRGLHREISALRAELADQRARQDTEPARAPEVPAARHTPAEEIRAAVAEALADEREREIAEARAFWAAHEAHDQGAELAGSPHQDPDLALLDDLAQHTGGDWDHSLPDGEDEPFLPRQSNLDEGREPALEASAPNDAQHGDSDTESPELSAARRRHPSHPDFNLRGEPTVPSPAPASAPTLADHERAIDRLAELAEQAVPLADVRPGPLGTLDMYVFADGTTLCASPGHRETAELLADAVRCGTPPVLLGGSGSPGAYSLTFTYQEGRRGQGRERSVYVLADRLIASI